MIEPRTITVVITIEDIFDDFVECKLMKAGIPIKDGKLEYGSAELIEDLCTNSYVYKWCQI